MSSAAALVALPRVQAAYYARLTGDDELISMISGVYDYVPEDAAYPYVVIGEGTEIADNQHGEFGRQTTQTLHVWSRYRGFAQGLAIANRIVELLDHQPLIIAGLRHIATRLEFMQTLTDPAAPGDLRHIPIRFRTITGQE
ncbi:DUF3168 domain-containing protein [uncultured Thermomonospora sp.]|uniref:DUF3168 domain-containing protein n=1 Tax=uncultured Thermomonospora sp. TaxID=671175 RepID=UPI00259B0AFB|nr:DUF3168 domain-containing protein [uncultured Thermomonospora sp.]